MLTSIRNGQQIPSASEFGDDGFAIETVGRTIYLIAPEGRGAIYAVGKLLHTANYLGNSMFAAPPQGLERPVMRDRFLHITPHYHTFFEVKDVSAIAPIIEELALWGMNGLSLEIEEAEYGDPFKNGRENVDGRRVWSKCKKLWKVGQGLGLKLGLVDSANDLYRDQISERTMAEGGRKFLDKPLANPMVPEARALLLRNKEHMYQDLNRSGIKLDNVLWFAYDTGGCFSNACQPWIEKFLGLTEDLGADAHKYWPRGRVFISDWWTSDWEAEVVTNYLNSHPSSQIDGIWKQDRTPRERFDSLNKRIPVMVFLDLSVAGFGTIGAQPLPTMIESFVGQGARRGMPGLMVYTEGIWDDYNKSLAFQAAWDPGLAAEEFSQQYAGYFFGSSSSTRFHRIVEQSERSWADARVPLAEFDRLRFIDTPVPAEALAGLTLSVGDKLDPRARGSWRWAVLEYRARIGKLAASLQSPLAFKLILETDLHAGVPADRLAERVRLKREQLNQYRQLVDELRSRVYEEPDNRMFPMRVEDDYMSEIISVPWNEWLKSLNEISIELTPRHR
jgi:hypothetical protein